MSNLNAVELFYAQAADEFVTFQTSSGLRLSLAFAAGRAKLVLASMETPHIEPLRWSALGSRGALRCLKHLGRLCVDESQASWNPRGVSPNTDLTAANLCPVVPWVHGVPSSGTGTSKLRQVLRCLHAIHVLNEPWDDATWTELPPSTRSIVWRLTNGPATCIVKVQALDT